MDVDERDIVAVVRNSYLFFLYLVSCICGSMAVWQYLQHLYLSKYTCAFLGGNSLRGYLRVFAWFWVIQLLQLLAGCLSVSSVCVGVEWIECESNECPTMSRSRTLAPFLNSFLVSGCWCCASANGIWHAAFVGDNGKMYGKVDGWLSVEWSVVAWSGG